MDREGTLSKAIDSLRGSPFFEGLGEDWLGSLAELAQRKDYAAGEIVFLENDKPGGIYVIESGWFKATKISKDGREQILDTLGPGYAVNVHNVFLGKPMPATLTALEVGALLYLPASAIMALVEREPQAAIAIIRTLAQRIDFLVAKIEDLSLRSVEARLAKYLLEHEHDGVVARKRWATQAELAAQMGTVLDVLNRVLKRFEERQLIEVGRREIRLIDLKQLHDIATE